MPASLKTIEGGDSLATRLTNGVLKNGFTDTMDLPNSNGGVNEYFYFNAGAKSPTSITVTVIGGTADTWFINGETNFNTRTVSGNTVTCDFASSAAADGIVEFNVVGASGLQYEVTFG